MYYKKVNHNSKADMIEFLTSHFRYYTMNSWNGTTSYANNVKIYNLNLPKDVKHFAWNFFDEEFAMPDFWDDANDKYINEFQNKYNVRVYSNGRSEGYLVLYFVEPDGNVYPGQTYNSDDPYYYEDWSRDMLKDEVNMLQDFDKLCDNLRELFIEHLRQYKNGYSTETEE